MLDVLKVINTAKSYEGTKEGKNNYNIYAEFFDKECKDFFNGPKQNVAYCSVFVLFCFVKSYGKSDTLKMFNLPLRSEAASSTYCYNRFKAVGRVGKDPEKGAVIYFKDKNGKICHTGIVIDVTNTHVFTVEGNKSDGYTKRCKYPIKSTKIYGYGYPDYDIKSEKPKEDPKPATPAKSYDVVVIAKSGLNVRKEPNKKCKVITVLPYKTIITVSDHNNEWLKYRDWYISKKWCEKINFSNNY